MNMPVLTKQWALMGGITLGAATLVAILAWAGGTSEESQKPQEHKVSMMTAGQVLNPQEIWVSKMEEEEKIRDKRVDALEKLVTTLLEERSQKEEHFPSEDTLWEAPNLISEQETDPIQHAPASPVMEDTPSQMPFPMMGGGEGSSQTPPPTGIVSRKIPLTPKNGGLVGSSQQTPLKKTIENTIPAGAYAEAIILGGVDASAATSSQADPRPVLIRLKDAGTLPRRFQSDLKDCHVLASAHGDLSSERVFMRLEKLTCTEPLTGEIIETEVAGYVAGEDGRAGVRGSVADRSGEAMRASFVGGFFSGMSQFFGATEQRAVYPISPFGQTQALSPQSMMTTGASHGVSNALDRYAEFYIKRAEQLQPVIQVAAGRTVTIVFTQGTEIGGSSVKKTLHKIRESSRQDIVQDLAGTPDSKTWLPSDAKETQ